MRNTGGKQLAHLNKVMIIGNVGQEPEMRFTPAGNPVTSFTVACNTKYGEEETTEWFNVTAWKKLAETCNQYLTKGQQVYVEGRLQTDSWESEGITRYKTKIIANTVIFLGKRKANDIPEEGELEPEDLPFD